MIGFNYFTCLLAAFLWIPTWAQSPSKITEEQREILTYSYNDPNPVAIHNKTAKIYPYTLFEGYSKEGKMQKWKVVKLENDYIEVYILPEVGGKIWGAIEKSTGKEFIYRNEVIKFRNIAMRGPWTSGGIEFNFGIIGHHPSTSSPVDYVTRKNDDGSVSCIVGNLDLPSRTTWRVEIKLPKDKAYVETKASWNNPTPINQSYYNWMTAAAVVSDDLEFFYPGRLALEHDGTPTAWPIDPEGRDLAKYKNNAFGSHKSVHTVGEYNDFMGGYYHQSKFGFGHWALYNEMPGRKLWLWALSRNGGIWEDLLTDADGQYMEFQAGRLFDQYSPSSSVKSVLTQVPFSPGTTDRWSEIWFPVKEIGGISEVSPFGILHVKVDGNKVQIGVNALSFADAVVEVKSNGKTVYSENKKFKPMEVFLATVPVDGNATHEVVVKGMDLRYSNERKNSLKRPFAASPMPKKFTADEMYREGVEYKEFREYEKAVAVFKQCLKNDSLHFGAITDMAELHYRSGMYDSALLMVNKVLRHDTYHPKANYVAGISYKAKDDLLNALESLGWAARATEFRSAAYAQMASVKMQEGDFALSENYARQALDFNRYNFNALHILAVLYRKSNNVANAKEIMHEIEKYDNLDHFAHYEKSLLTKSQDDFSIFSDRMTNEFPYQTYLEVALEYLSLGLREDAQAVLAKSPRHPLITIWSAYLKNDAGALNEVVAKSPAFVFPYRTETIKPLEWAVSQNQDWKFKYFLGLNYYFLQRKEEAINLFQVCGKEPDYAPFYLTRTKLITDQTQVLTDLRTANKLSPNEWRTWSYLIDYYEKSGNDKEELAVAREASKKFESNYTLGFEYAKALLNNRQYEATISALKELYILPFEGSGEGKTVYEQATLLRALELIGHSKYKEALQKIDDSRQWPENLGVGKPYDVDTRIQDYLAAYCLDKIGKKREAVEYENNVIAYTESNIAEPSANTILAFVILQRKKQNDKAKELLQKIKTSAVSEHIINRWVIALAEKNDSVLPALDKDIAGNKFADIIKSIIKL
jgi:tetratricopeptide (TPR) repeat protein